MKPSFRHDDSMDSAGSTSSFSGGHQQFSEEVSGLEQPPYERTEPFNSVSSISSLDATWETGALTSQESVYQLTKDLRTFSEALTALKAVFLDDKTDMEDRGLRVLAHERLGELLQVLKMVVDKYSELNSSEILAMAGVLIKHVKEFNYEDEENDVSPEIFRAVNNLAMIFSKSVSECLMGEASISPHVSAVQPFELTSSKPAGDATEAADPSVAISPPSTKIDTTYVEGADEVLHRMESGIEKAFERAKILSKYLGELITFVKKKAHLEWEHTKTLQKLAQSTKAILSEQSFLPFQSLYCTALDHDREFASNCQSMYQTALLQQKFVEPLLAKKNEHDKRRKSIRDSWLREKKRLEEAVSTMKKAKMTYHSRVNEYQKAKEAAMKAEGELSSQSSVSLKSSAGGTTLGSVLMSTTTKMDKKKKQEEDTSVKASTAELAFRSSVGEANFRLRDLDKKKSTYLQQLRELMLQCDQTAKTVTVSYFQLHHRLFAPLPIQAMCEDAKRYEPGFQFADYIRNIPAQSHQPRTEFSFEQYGSEGANYLVHPEGRTTEDGDSHTHKRHFSGNKALSDSESTSSRSLDDISSSASPGDPRRHSMEGSLSSEDLLDDGTKDAKPHSNLSLQVEPTPETSPVPTRSFTKNAIKMAANVKEAFSKGKKPKSTLFGVDLATASQGALDGIPFLVKRCIAEIDNRALSTKGIYRVNGVKNRVEKLCTQFDLYPDRVDLSNQSPHDVSGVLKYFLRQLPEPLLQFNLYATFIEIAKDYQQLINSTNEATNQAKEEGLLAPPPPSVAILQSYVDRVRDTVQSLPMENRNTLQYIVSHLTRISYHCRDNKMTSSNLAIVFGPTMMRPVLTDGNESLKTLIDMPYQSRIVEMLIVHKDAIFGTQTHQAGNIFPFSGFQHPHPPYSSDEQPGEHAEADDSGKDDISHQDEILLNFTDEVVSSLPNPSNINNPSTPDNNTETDNASGYLQHCLAGSGAIVSNSIGVSPFTERRGSSALLQPSHEVSVDNVLLRPKQLELNPARLYKSPSFGKHQPHNLANTEGTDVISQLEAFNASSSMLLQRKSSLQKRRTSLSQIGKSVSHDVMRHLTKSQKTKSLTLSTNPPSSSDVGCTPPVTPDAPPRRKHAATSFEYVREEEGSSFC